VTCGGVNDRDLGRGDRLRHRHINPEKHGGKKCSPEMYKPGNMMQKDYCIHKESSKELKDKVKNKTYIITFCPIDCVMGEWSKPKMCPECWGGDTNLNRTEAHMIPYIRTRTPKIFAKYKGKPCPKNYVDQSNCEDAGFADDSVPECDSKVDIPATWSEWHSWSNCKSEFCGKRGQMVRTRKCKEGKKTNEETGGIDEVPCEGLEYENRDCPNHCAPTGWGVWKIGNCAVTCGKGVLIRVRVCRDQLKTELAEKSDCIKKVGNDKKQRQTEACDMGPCPGDIEEPGGYKGGPDPWQSWSDCSKSCGKGIQTRTRSAQCPPEAKDGCDPEESSKPCNIKPCSFYKRKSGQNTKTVYRKNRRKSRGRKRGSKRRMGRGRRGQRRRKAVPRKEKHQNVTHQRKPASG